MGGAWGTMMSGAAALVNVFTDCEHPLALAGYWDVVATLGVWVLSLLTRNSSCYDPYWSIVPPAFVVYWGYALETLTPRQAFICVVVYVWGTRLTLNWWNRLGRRLWKEGMAVEEDWRYEMISNNLDKGGPIYWIVGSLGGIHLFPTILVFLGCVPIYLVLAPGAAAALGLDAGAEQAPTSIADYLVCMLGLFAVWLQLQADRGMDAFLANPANKGQVCREGLWGLCRHPNYLGEVTMWSSCALFALNAWGVVATIPACTGALAMFLLFGTASIPMMEKRQIERRGAGYIQYMREVPCGLPTTMVIPVEGVKEE